MICSTTNLNLHLEEFSNAPAANHLRGHQSKSHQLDFDSREGKLHLLFEWSSRRTYCLPPLRKHRRSMHSRNGWKNIFPFHIYTLIWHASSHFYRLFDNWKTSIFLIKGVASIRSQCRVLEEILKGKVKGLIKHVDAIQEHRHVNLHVVLILRDLNKVVR